VRWYRDLIVWEKAMTLAESVYRATLQLPKEETYGLISQMRRAAVSIAGNIAEGHSRSSRGEFLQFIGHARGSLSELETQTILATRLGFLSPDAEQQLMNGSAEVGRLLNGLRDSLKRQPESDP
jgi:four helix bundle protein